MIGVASSVLWFVVAVGLLVTVHEFGHFWVARRLGVKVLRFSIGFGRALWTRRGGRDDTEFVVAAIPLGGYVKMLDESEGEVAAADRHRAFNRQPLWVRIAVVSAGPVFNFLFAVAAYWVMFMVGVSGLRPLVGDVEPGSIAARAGVAAGQEIVRVADERTHTWEGVIQSLIGRALADAPVEIGVDDGAGVASARRLDLRGVVIDDLTRGRFFETIGVTPQRPAIPPVIGELTEGGRAEAAGLEPGDRVLEANGDAIADWSAWVEYVRARPEERLDTLVERDGAQRTVELVPAAVEDGGEVVGRIGAGVEVPPGLVERYYATERYGPLEALGRGVAKTGEITVLTLRMLWKMLLLEVSLDNLSGPISIAQYAGLSAESGLARYVGFLAIVSISLGILNLLPIPVLDGGHLLYYLIELARGRPLSEEAQFVGQRLGIAMLVGLMGLAFYNDIARLFG